MTDLTAGALENLNNSLAELWAANEESSESFLHNFKTIYLKIIEMEGEEPSQEFKTLTAAPDLLEALKAVNHSVKQGQISGNDWRRELCLCENITTRAIAKAEGSDAAAELRRLHEEIKCEERRFGELWEQFAALDKTNQELVEALKAILENDGGRGSKCFNALRLSDARDRAYAAIAKATGQA
jgi:hypothetical protein